MLRIFTEIGKNRCWAQIQCEKGPLAMGVAYMATQDNKDKNGGHNDTLFEILRRDCDQFRKDEIPIILFGDFNGWIGDGTDGILGNRPETNLNGQRLIAFGHQMDMAIVQTEQRLVDGQQTPICNEIWTRQQHDFCS